MEAGAVVTCRSRLAAWGEPKMKMTSIHHWIEAISTADFEPLFVLPVGFALLGEGAGTLDQVFRLEEFFGRREVGLVSFLERQMQASVGGFLARLDRERGTFHDFG